MKSFLKFIIITGLTLSFFASFSQEVILPQHYTEPNIQNQKHKHIFVPFKKSQLTIFNKNRQHLTGQLIGISDSLILIKFINDTNVYAFDIDNLSKINYKKGYGFSGGIILGSTISTALSSLVLLEKNDGWQVLGFYILMLTVVPATTFVSGGISAILSDRISINMTSESKLKKLNRLAKFNKLTMDRIVYIHSDFMPIETIKQ